VAEAEEAAEVQLKAERACHRGAMLYINTFILLLLNLLLVTCLYLEICHIRARVAETEAEGGGGGSRLREHATGVRSILERLLIYNAFTSNITACMSIFRRLLVVCLY